MKKVIITGCPRSGTTGLANLLSQDKQTLITNEVGNFTYNLDNTLSIMLARKYEESVFRSFLQLKGIGEEYWKSSKFYENQSYCETLANDYNLSVIGDKWPDYLFHLNDVEMMNNGLEDFYFIFTIRSCRHFINSSTSGYNKGLRNVWNFYDKRDAEKYWLKYNLKLIESIQTLQQKKIPHCVIKYEEYNGYGDCILRRLSKLINHKFKVCRDRCLESYFFAGNEIDCELSSDTEAIMELLGYEVNY